MSHNSCETTGSGSSRKNNLRALVMTWMSHSDEFKSYSSSTATVSTSSTTHMYTPSPATETIDSTMTVIHQHLQQQSSADSAAHMPASTSTEQSITSSCVGLPRVPTRVINYPGNFLLPAATRVPKQKQITANVLNISAIFNRFYGIRISIYRILTHHQ